MTVEVQGYKPSVFELHTDAHGIVNIFATDTNVKGGSFEFAQGTHLQGSLTDCESIVCAGTLVIGKDAVISAKKLKTNVLIQLGHLKADEVIVTGTLVAWSGSISAGVVHYGAMEKSSGCKISGSLESIEPQDNGSVSAFTHPKD